MPKIPFWPFFLLSFFMNTILMHVNSASASIESVEVSEIGNSQRKLESGFHSVTLKKGYTWYVFGVPSAYHDPYDLYLPSEWAIFISSNETILSSGGCSLFEDFICSSSGCSEDRSSLYSQNYTHFSISNASRLSLIKEEISIAGGAWNLNSSAIYVHNCEIPKPHSGLVIGQIGLGLSGKAHQNFKTLNPIFSIVLHSFDLGELIFEFNSTYVSENSIPITLPCDLDWKMQVTGLTMDDAIISSASVAMIFDLQTLSITLPESYFYGLLEYFNDYSSFTGCQLNSHANNFVCFYVGDLQDLPPLTFVLEDGIRFPLSPESYMIKGDNIYIATFFHHNSTFSGIDYIILGRDIMGQYYTVFQQLTNETARITVYPHPIVNPFFIKPDNPFSPESTGTPMRPSLSEVEPNISPEEPVSEDTDYVSSPSEDQIPTFQEEDNGLEDKTELYIILFISFIIIICLLTIIYLRKRDRLKEDQTEERQGSTMEMNESAYFVDNNDSHNDNHENEVCE